MTFAAHSCRPVAGAGRLSRPGAAAHGAARADRRADRRARAEPADCARPTPRRPRSMSTPAARQPGRDVGGISIVSHVPARRSRREGGDDPAAAGLAVVLGDHHQQVAGARHAQAQARDEVREDVLVGPVAGRALSAIRRQAPIIPWRRCSSRPCANGAAPSKAARRAKAMLPGIKERIDKAMSVTILRETDGIERQLGFLATVGSIVALHRPVRHGVGHHEFVLGHRRAP